MTKSHEITFATVAGHNVPAEHLVCPTCKTFDIDLTAGPCSPCVKTRTEGTEDRWGATCSRRHHWHFPVPTEAVGS